MTAQEALTWGDFAIGYAPILVVLMILIAVIRTSLRTQPSPEPNSTSGQSIHQQQSQPQQQAAAHDFSTPARTIMLASQIDGLSDSQWMVFALGLPAVCGLTAWAHVNYGILDCELGNMVHTAAVKLLEAEGEVHPAVIPGFIAIGTALWMFTRGVKAQQNGDGGRPSVVGKASSHRSEGAASAPAAQRQCLVLLRQGRSYAGNRTTHGDASDAAQGSIAAPSAATTPAGTSPAPVDADLEEHISQLRSVGSLMAGGTVVGHSISGVRSVLLFHTGDQAAVETCMRSNPAIAAGRLDFEVLELSTLLA